MTQKGFFKTLDGCRIAWRADGPIQAPALVLSNSLGSSMAMWEGQIADLSRHFRVIRYDQRGHGASDSPAGETSIDRLGCDVTELLDALEVERAHFCGVSLGGMTGQWLGYRKPERFDRMIFSNTAACMQPARLWQDRIETVRERGTESIADAVVQRWVTLAFACTFPGRFQALRAMIAATDANGYAACCAAIRDLDLRPSAPLIRRPVLVICGKDDPATPPFEGSMLACAIPTASLAVLPGAHLANIESPEEFSRLAIDFLTRQP